MRRRRIGGRYQIEAEIGSGGMGTVYRARDNRTSRTVAVKLLHAHLVQDQQYVERFRREAQIAKSLESIHIVEVLDVGEDEGQPFIVMEYVPGTTLREILEAHHRFSPKEALALCLQIAEALSEAHRKGVVHRDIKPQNIILTSEGLLKVADFGLAKAEDLSTLTLSGSFFGTLQYAAPERFEGEGDIRSDVYSAGIMLYQMLTGSVPFAADSALALIRLHNEKTPPPINEYVPDITEDVQDLVSRCLAKDPAERFQSPDQFVNAIVRILPERGAEVDVTQISLPRERVGLGAAVRRWWRHRLEDGRRRGWWIALAGGGFAGLVAAAVVIGLALTGDREDVKPLVTDPTPTATISSGDVSLTLHTPQVSGRMVTINGVTKSDTGSISRIHWDWGDGASENHWFPASHTYSADGTYTVTVTAYDDLGGSATRTAKLEVPTTGTSQATETPAPSITPAPSQTATPMPPLTPLPTPISTPTRPAGDDFDPAWSPNGARIAYVSSRDGNNEIYVMNADGSSQTRLTDNAAHDFSPAWSPDGGRIAFHSYRDGNSNIYVMNADGSGLARLTDAPAYQMSPAWSPNGTRIAFEMNQDIYVMNGDGSSLTRLTDDPAYEWSPAWSPDGTRIAFWSTRDGNSEIYVMNADGSALTRLTNHVADDFWPAWSPDSSQIAFTSERDGVREIYVMNVDGSGLVNLTNYPAADSDPTWSPDGTRIAFVSHRDGNDEVYVMDADGSEQTNLTNNPAWEDEPASSSTP
jgi:predicted Ser/Thr protein kinase